MADTNPKTSIIRQKNALARFRTSAGELLNNVLTLSDDKHHIPFEISISGDIITIGASEIQMLESDGSGSTQNANKKAIQPEGGIYNSVAESTINVDTGATTGDFQDNPPTLPVAIPASEYVWMGIEKRPDNKLYPVFGIPHAVSGSATYPVFLSRSGAKSICMILLRDDGAGSSGVTWNFLAPVITDFVLFESSGGGGGEGDANSILEDMKDWLDHSPYGFLEANIARINEDDLLDVASTASYSVANKTFLFTAGQILISENMANPQFLTELIDLSEVYVRVVYDIDYVDFTPNIDVSRDGGNEYQDVTTMERIGTTDTFIGRHIFDAEASDQTLQEYAVANADATQDLTDTGNNQKLSQEFTPIKVEQVKVINVYVNKVGNPTGVLKVSIVKDDSGSPDEGSTKTMISSFNQSIADMAAGNNAVALTVSGLLGTVKYHLVFETDDNYKGSYSNGVNELGVRVDSSSPTITAMKQHNGSTWATISGNAAVYKLEGRELDLKIKITASTGSQIKGIGLYMGKGPQGSSSFKKLQTFEINTSSNVTEFDITSFVVDQDLLEIWVVKSGSSLAYRYPSFALEATATGTKAVFPDKTFYWLPGEDLTVVADQNKGSSFDNSDANGALLTDNHLGSPNSSRNRSVAGRGIYLKRDDGTLREVTINNSDVVVIKSVP